MAPLSLLHRLGDCASRARLGRWAATARPAIHSTAFGRATLGRATLGRAVLAALGAFSALYWQPIAAATSPDEKPLTSVADLRYGVALYNYFQEDYLQALSELMVAVARGGIQGHGDNPAIMRGGFYLAYGMERTATDIFNRLLDQNRPQATRDAAWFYLAKLRYMRGDFAGSQAALAKVSNEPERPLAEELQALRVNLALQAQQLEEAERLLADPVLQGSSWLPYLQFNTGAAFARAQQFDKSVDYFNKLLYLKTFNAPELALYDKAMTAAGFAQLLKGDYQAALDAFTQVRLDSPMSNRALLGYGWAAVEMKDYALALKPWQVLTERSLSDANTQESLVAVPFAYEKMGYPQLALEHFRRAEAAYLDHLGELQQVVAQMPEDVIKQVLALDALADDQWLEQAEQNELSPVVVYLTELFAAESFLGRVRELRDLLAIQDNFEQWQRKLALYSGMLNEREANRVQEERFMAQRQLRQQINQLSERRDEAAQELNQLRADDEVLALLDEQQEEKLARIERGEKNLAVLREASAEGRAVMTAAELEQLAENLRLLKGEMIWSSAQVFDARLELAEQQLEALDQLLPQLSSRLEQVEQIAGLSLDVQPFRQRIARAQQSLQAQSADIEQAVEQAQASLRAQILAVVDAERSRVEGHLAQARLSIARLMDSQRLELRDAPADANAEATP